jgi:hypothetical protein
VRLRRYFLEKSVLSEWMGPIHDFSYGPTGNRSPNDGVDGVCETPHPMGVASTKPMRSVHAQVFSGRRAKWQHKKRQRYRGLVGIQSRA